MGLSSLPNITAHNGAADGSKYSFQKLCTEAPKKEDYQFLRHGGERDTRFSIFSANILRQQLATD